MLIILNGGGYLMVERLRNDKGDGGGGGSDRNGNGIDNDDEVP